MQILFFRIFRGDLIIGRNNGIFPKKFKTLLLFLINFGIRDDGTIIEAGINAKLNEYQCAVGLTLLDNIDEVIQHRRVLFDLYFHGLNEVVQIPMRENSASINGAYFVIKLESEDVVNKLQKELALNNIQSR